MGGHGFCPPEADPPPERRGVKPVAGAAAEGVEPPRALSAAAAPAHTGPGMDRGFALPGENWGAAAHRGKIVV